MKFFIKKQDIGSDFVLKRSHIGIIRNKAWQHVDCCPVIIIVIKQIFEITI